MSIRLKRSITLLLALAVAAVLCTSVALASVGGKTTSNLNKRSSPSTSSSKVGLASKGSSITVVSKISDGEKYGSITVSGDWYELSDGSCVSADYVSLSAPLEDDEEELPPDDEDDELEELPLDDDEEFEDVDEDDGGDVTIEDEGEEVSVDDDDEIPVDSDEDEDAVLPDDLEDDEIPGEDEETKISTVNASSLNMRSTPSLSGAVVAKLVRNSVVTIVDELSDGDKYDGSSVSGNWYEITYNGKTGFVSSRYIKTSTASSGAVSTITVPIRNTQTTYKTTRKVTVYKLPTTMASTNGTLDSATKVSIQKTINDGSSFDGLSVDVSGKWYKIGSSRYIQAKYVSSATSTGTSSVEIPLGTKLVTTSAVRQRSKPSTSSTQLGKLEKGDSIVIVGAVLNGSTYNGAKVSGNWIQIKGGGFVSADYVALP